MAQSYASQQTPQEGQRRRNCGLKKINTTPKELKVIHSGKKVRLMFQDEAGFGRINKPKYCWCERGIRPTVPCHHIREYRYAYGAVESLTGEGYFLVMPYCNRACMSIFLKQLSAQYPEDIILFCCDGAAWHKSGGCIFSRQNIKYFSRRSFSFFSSPYAVMSRVFSSCCLIQGTQMSINGFRPSIRRIRT